jgi:hypothetical protein
MVMGLELLKLVLVPLALVCQYHTTPEGGLLVQVTSELPQPLAMVNTEDGVEGTSLST